MGGMAAQGWGRDRQAPTRTSGPYKTAAKNFAFRMRRWSVTDIERRATQAPGLIRLQDVGAREPRGAVKTYG